MEGDIPKLFSLLINHCPQPTSVNININNCMSQEIKQALYIGESLLKTVDIKSPLIAKTYIATTSFLLRKVEILKLRCDNYTNIGVVILT